MRDTLIGKYQYGNPLIQADHQRRGYTQQFINNGVRQIGMQAREAEAKNAQLRKISRYIDNNKVLIVAYYKNLGDYIQSLTSWDSGIG